MPRVLICDKLETPGLELLREAGIELDERTGLKGADLLDAVRAADAIIVRSATQVTAEVLENPGKLRAVVRAGVGVDNIDVPAATRKGIVVMNTPGGNTLSTAEHAFALLMALSRHIPAAHASTRAFSPTTCRARSRITGSRMAAVSASLASRSGPISRAAASVWARRSA